jgi:hypothetical protein
MNETFSCERLRLLELNNSLFWEFEFLQRKLLHKGADGAEGNETG